MATYLGIDIGTNSVRAVRLRSAYRRLAVEAVIEADRANGATLVDLLRGALGPLMTPGDSVSVSFEGERTLVRQLAIPVAGQKQLAELVPFELEADLPFDLEEAVHDHLVLRRPRDQVISLLAAAARLDHVRERIGTVREALSIEPERIIPGGLALAALVGVLPALSGAGPVAVIDLDETRTDVLVIERGESVFCRTLSRGTAGLPQSATQLARDLRQTIAAWRASGGGPPTNAYLAGPGATVAGAEAFIGAELGLPVERLPSPEIAIEAPEGSGSLLRCAKALSLALSLLPRARTINLRQQALAYEGGYGFLRDKVPILSSLAAVIVASFAFAAVAQFSTLASERKVLEAALLTVSKDVLGQEVSDPEQATDLLDKATAGSDEDPLPHADAFDVMVQLAEAVPEGIKHDVEEFDVQRAHVTVHGVVPTIPDAQQIATQLKSFRCFPEPKIVKTVQEVNGERQKYTLEMDIKCPEEGKEARDKTAPAGSASAGGTGGTKP